MTEILEIAKKDGRWTECPSCKETCITDKLRENLSICPHCDHHFRITALERITITCDEQGFSEIDPKLLAQGLSSNASSGTDAIHGYNARIEGQACIAGIMDFGYRGGTMGVVMGQSVLTLTRMAHEAGLPLIMFCASGGVRVQEGIWGLMQMLRTVHARSTSNIPMITVFTDPTYGGVTASFSALADIALAEPGARIGFAGPRVIDSTMHASLPPDFQNASRLLSHGFIDQVVHRSKLKETLGYILKWF